MLSNRASSVYLPVIRYPITGFHQILKLSLFLYPSHCDSSKGITALTGAKSSGHKSRSLLFVPHGCLHTFTCVLACPARPTFNDFQPNTLLYKRLAHPFKKLTHSGIQQTLWKWLWHSYGWPQWHNSNFTVITELSAAYSCCLPHVVQMQHPDQLKFKLTLQ